MELSYFTQLVLFLLATCLQGGLYGIYSGLFAIHLACHASKRETDSSKPTIIFYALGVVYVLTGVLFILDIVHIFDDKTLLYYRLSIASDVLFGCCDFIAQCILIHRCWIVYGRNIRVIIVPSILAFAYLVMWLATNGAFFVARKDVYVTRWAEKLTLTSLATSMTVNALVTGLIVFRISKVFREVASVTASEEKSLLPGGNKLRSVVFIIIESGMVLFAIQLARVAITTSVKQIDRAYYALEFIGAIHQIVNGIAPTIILVRVSLGLSFHDQESLVEAVSSLQFGASPISEAGSIDQDNSSHIGHDHALNPLPVMGERGEMTRLAEVTRR